MQHTFSTPVFLFAMHPKGAAGGRSCRWQSSQKRIGIQRGLRIKLLKMFCNMLQRVCAVASEFGEKMNEKKQREKYVFWVSKTRKCISFRGTPGYEAQMIIYTYGNEAYMAE